MHRNISYPHESLTAHRRLDPSFCDQLSHETTEALKRTGDPDLRVDFNEMLTSASHHVYLKVTKLVERAVK